MDEEKILILVNGEDKTNQVEKIYTNQYGKIEIKYYKKEKINLREYMELWGKINK